MTTKPKLPALTSADIEALPDAAYIDEYGERLLKWTDSDGEACFSHFDARPSFSLQRVMKRGGITARLVDPAPLEALLREADGLLNEMRRGAACQPKMDNSCGCKYCRHNKLAKRIEAALEGNDG